MIDPEVSDEDGLRCRRCGRSMIPNSIGWCRNCQLKDTQHRAPAAPVQYKKCAAKIPGGYRATSIEHVCACGRKIKGPAFALHRAACQANQASNLS